MKKFCVIQQINPTLSSKMSIKNNVKMKTTETKKLKGSEVISRLFGHANASSWMLKH